MKIFVTNIVGGQPVELMDFIRAIERAMDKDARLNLLPMQPVDVIATESDTTLLKALIGTIPATPIDVGVSRFVEWFKLRRQPI